MRLCSRSNCVLLSLATSALFAFGLTESAAQEVEEAARPGRADAAVVPTAPGRADAAVVPTAPGLDLDSPAEAGDDGLAGFPDLIEPPAGAPLEATEAEPKRTRIMVRASLWIALAASEFRNGVGATTFSLEGKFDAFPLEGILPIEGLVRTENQEFGIRFVWWRRSADKTMNDSSFKFGSTTFILGEKVSADLTTGVASFDFLHRVLEKERFDLYIATGGDLYYTSLKLSGAGSSDRLEEYVPVLTVGLGMRINVRREMSLLISHTALSLSQLLFIDEEFFANKDVYRNIEVSLMWEKSEAWDVGVGWRHFDVSFRSNRLEASQMMSGVSCWARFKF